MEVILPNNGLAASVIAAKGAPIAFTASVTGLNVDQTLNFDSGALTPNFRQPYLVDEIRMLVVAPPAVTPPSNGSGFGCVVNFLFETGHYRFSKVPVPAALFAPRMGNTVENIGAAGRVGVDECLQIDALGLGNYYNVYRWVLPKPLLLGPGDSVQAQVSRDLSMGEEFLACDASICVVGRMLPPGFRMPPTCYVPWVGVYSNTQITPSGIKEVATTDEFKNQWVDKNWWVQRLVARSCYQLIAAGATTALIMGGVGAGDPVTPNVPPPDPFAPPRTPEWSVKLYDSNSYAIIPIFTPIGAVAPQFETSAWTFSRNVGPSEQLDLTNQYDFRNGFYTNKTMVGMIGYREEAL